jgi:hypothetical protein
MLQSVYKYMCQRLEYIYSRMYLKVKMIKAIQKVTVLYIIKMLLLLFTCIFKILQLQSSILKYIYIYIQQNVFNPYKRLN